MNIQSLPAYVYHEFEFDDGVERKKCFLSLNRDINGNWSCGYVTWDEEWGELAIPQLVTNNSKDITEVAVRMEAKVQRYLKGDADYELEGHKS